MSLGIAHWPGDFLASALELMIAVALAGAVVCAVRRRRPASGWLKELGLVGCFYGLYSVLRDGLPAARKTPALAHAHTLVHAERKLGAWIEPTAASWLHHSQFAVGAAECWYSLAHLFGTAGVLVWLFVSRSSLYRPARNVLFCCSVGALAVFTLFPVAPPRLIGVQGAFPAAESALGLNYASVPSLHIAWAVWVAWVLWIGGSKSRKALAVAYPVVTTVVVVATGNHYLLDVAAGAAWFALFYAGAKVFANQRAARRWQRSIAAVELAR